MKSIPNQVFLGISLISLLAGAPVAATTHHKLCVPQGTKLASACQYHGYVKGARAHFKADRRAQESHHSTKE